MSEFNVKRRYILNVSINDGATVTVQIEVNTEGDIRIRPVGYLNENDSLYLYIGKEKVRA